jgi:hypothetical protein
MKRLNSLFVCSCCGGITKFPRVDVCPSCYQWAANSLVSVIADGIQAELSRAKVAKVLDILDKVKAAQLACGV